MLKQSKRLLGMLLTLALVFTLLPTVALAADVIATDATISSNGELNLGSGATVEISSGVTLTNYGSIIGSGTITNNGTIINYGTIDPTITITGGTMINVSMDEIVWSSSFGGDASTGSTPIALTSDITTVLVTSGASGTLTIPDGVTELTIRGIDGTPTVVTDGQIEVTNTGSLALTLQDLDIKASDHKSAINATSSSSVLTLNCDNVTLTGGTGVTGAASTDQSGHGIFASP